MSLDRRRFTYPLTPIADAAARLGAMPVAPLVHSAVRRATELSPDDLDAVPPFFLLAVAALNTLRHVGRAPDLPRHLPSPAAVQRELHTVCTVWRSQRPDATRAWCRQWMIDPVRRGDALLREAVDPDTVDELLQLQRAAYAALCASTPNEVYPPCVESYMMSNAETVIEWSEMFSSGWTRHLEQQLSLHAQRVEEAATLRLAQEAATRAAQPAHTRPSRSVVSPTPPQNPSAPTHGNLNKPTVIPSKSVVDQKKPTWRRRKTAPTETSIESLLLDIEAPNGKNAPAVKSKPPLTSQPAEDGAK